MTVKTVIALSHQEEPFRAVVDEFKRRDLDEQVDLIRSYDKDHLSNLIIDADVVLCWRLEDEFIKKARNLSWIAVASAGVDKALTNEVLLSDIVLTNSSGVGKLAVAEHALSLMFALSRQLHSALKNQMKREWNRSEIVDDIFVLSGKVVGIMGIGSIGRELAELCDSLGLTVYGYDIEEVKGDFIDKSFTPDTIEDFLGDIDILAITLPLTPDTYHLIDSEKIAKMKDGVILINVSRGLIIKEDDLISALNRGKVAGAGLDVFSTEPLPEDHPFYYLDNVIITPHIGGVTPGYWEDLSEQFADNMELFLKGEKLMNTIDKERRY